LRPSKPLRKQGRPPNNAVDRLFTIVWFRQVLALSDTRNAYAFEIRFELETSGEVITGANRKHAWDNYVSGKQIPNDNDSQNSRIAQAEKLAPGSARYFRSPLRHILKGGCFDETQMRLLLFALPQEIRAVVFEDPKDPYSALCDFDNGSALVLFNRNDFDALEALILLNHWASHIGSRTLSDNLARLYREMQPNLKQCMEMRPIAKALFEHIDPFFAHRHFTKSTEAIDIVFPYHLNLVLAEKTVRLEPLKGSDTAPGVSPLLAKPDITKIGFFEFFQKMTWHRRVAMLLGPLLFYISLSLEEKGLRGGLLTLLLAGLLTVIVIDERVANYRPSV
jgi:hypothetical protein